MAIYGRRFSGGGSAVINTVGTGLTLSAGTLTANLSTGVAGGQSVVGGTAASESLTISSTAHATKGTVVFGTTAGMLWNEATSVLTIGGANANAPLSVATSGLTTQIHFASSTADSGGYLLSAGASLGAFSAAAAFNGSAWIAKATTSASVQLNNGVFIVTTNNGLTAGNSFTQNIRFQISGTGAITWPVAATFGAFDAAAVSQQVSAANLTNNVTVGGTNNQVDDVVAAPVDVNAASLTSTRDAVYQLARKLKQVNDGLRAYGWLT